MMKSSSVEVTTVSGKSLPRIKCRFISNQYYEIGVDCFLMEDGKWHRKNNGKVDFDHETQKYVLIEQSQLVDGAIGITPQGKPIIGKFSVNPAKNVEISTREYGLIRCINEDIPLSAGFKEDVGSGAFYLNIPDKDLSVKRIAGRYSFNLEYSSAPKLKIFNGSYKEHYTPKTDVSSRFFKEFGKTTFGIEFETDNGFIPERHLFRNGLIPVKDGSLRHDKIEPYEYTTIPLSGELGLKTVIDDVTLLQKHTTISHRCALHVHQGGFTPTKEMIVAMHKILIRIQDEIFSMFPPNYRFTSKNGFKAKDYCAPIKNIKFAKGEDIDAKFEKILYHYAGGTCSWRGFGRDNHPKDRANQRKWDISERYFICNFVPVLWGPTGTFEWRIHPPTQNVSKILNWLFITSAIINFVEKYQRDISSDDYNLKPINLDFILKEMYSQDLSKLLSSYLQERKDMSERMALSMNDLTGNYELINDLTPVKYSVL